MKFETGFAVIGVAMLLFYLRLAQLRGRHKKLARKEALARIQDKNKRKKGEPLVINDKNQPPFQVTSWWLVGGGVLLMSVGLALRTSDWFPVEYKPYWWVVVTVGVVVFTFCFK